MPLNPFDEAVDELGPPQPAVNPYDAIVNEHVGDQAAKLRTTALQATTQNPDQAADARKLADRYGLPASVVESNYDAFKKRAQLDDVDQVVKDAPALGAWLADKPSNAAIAQDDHGALSSFDKVAGFTRRALGDTGLSLLKGAIALPEAAVGLADIATLGHVGKFLDESIGYQPELAKSILSTFYSQAQARGFASVSEADGAIATAVAALSNPSVIAHSVLESLPLMLTGAAAGAAFGFLSPALAGAVGEGLGQAGGAAEQSRTAAPPPAALSTGQVAAGTVDLYAQPKVRNADGTTSTVDSVGVNVDGKELLLPTVTPDGRHFTGPAAVDLAIAEYQRTGRHLGVFASPEASTAYAEQLHTDYAAGRYEPEKKPKATGLLTPKQAALAASSGVVTGAISAFGGTLAQRLGIADVETLLAGGAVSDTARRGLVAQLLFGAVEEGFIEELPQSVSEQIHQNIADGRPLSEGVDEAAVMGAFAGAVMGGGGNAVERAQAHFLKQIGDVAKESKTVERAPAAAEDFLRAALDGGPTEHLYAPIDTFTTYWQGKGQDPAAIAAALTNDPDAYQAAVASGEDLVIPTARYIAQLAATDHHAFFENELRLSPDLLNAREQADYAAAQAEAGDQAETPATPRDQMREALTQDLTAGGYLPRDAAANANLVDAGFGTMAENAGEDPFATLANYGLELRRPDLATAAAPIVGPAELPAVSEAAVAGPDVAAAPPAVSGDAIRARALEAAGAAETPEERIRALEADLRSATRAAEMDSLTGVANRAALDKALPAAEADPETHVVVFDANNFGQVNKQVGHEAGDAMLQEMSAAIVQAAAEFGVGERVFRRGGDEFVVLAPADVSEQIRARAVEIFGERPIESPDFLTNTPAVSVSLSGTAGSTFAEADATLQSAKQAAKAAQTAGDPRAQALANLQRTGVASGPGGLKVRVLPTSGPDGEFELEITEKGNRSFEGKYTLEEAQTAGAARLAELAANPTKAPVTPQIVPMMSVQDLLKIAKISPQKLYQYRKAEVDALTQEIQRHGITTPISVRLDPTTGKPIAIDNGHHRLAVALKLGMKEVPVRFGNDPSFSDIAKSLKTPDEAPIVEVQSDETPEGRTDVVDGGGPAGPGDAGEPAGRPGDARAADLAGEQPDPRAPVQKKPRAPRRPGKRRAAGRAPRVGAGAGTASAGVDAGASAGSVTPAHVDTADLAGDADVAAAEARGEAPRRFAIDDTATLTEGGWAAKLDDNLAAIRLLKVLARESRMATDAEQAVLARYIGWGHTELKDVVEFEGGQSTLGNRDPRKQKARDELDTLLTQAELKELGESTPNAHYSFADLPRAMWAAVQRLGFRGGSILEPAVGTGHFLGTMPGAIVAQKQTRVFAVEKEPIAAAISRQLYQDTHVQTTPLQDANLPDNYFDLQISNVPFGRISIFDPAFHSSSERRQLDKVHNYYFGKSQDLARPGGIVAFVTSRYTMDSRSDSVRAFLAKRFNLLGAVRLPDQAFKATAGTDVVTDILFLQKRAEDEAATGPAWQQSPLNEALSPTNYNGDITNPIHTNEYFQAHPEHVLGTQNLTGKQQRTSVPQYNVQGSLTFEQLVEGLTRALPADVYVPSTKAPRKLAAVISRDVKQGSFQVEGGDLFLYDKGTLAPSDLTGKPRDIAKAFVPLRDSYQAVLDTMVRGGTDADLKKAQKALLGKYKFFVATHGLVNEPANRRVFEQDPNAGRIIALERIEVVRKKGKRADIKLLGYADIFTTRTYRPVVEATTADSPAAALTQSLAWKGSVDLGYMALLTGQTETDLVSALAGELYRNPVTQAYEPKAEYLSGDVTTKLAQAEAAALDDPAYKDNVTALTAVIPNQWGAEDFPAPFGATWVPPEVYARFVQAEMRGSNATVTLVNGETRVHWYVEGGYGRHEFLPAGADAMKWVENALNGELPVINSGKPPTRDEAATDAYRESLKQLRERWAEWWPTDPEASEKLVKIYNGMFNRDAAYVADGSHLELPGSNPAIALRWWQKNVVWRARQTANTLMAPAVGAGKTFAMVGIAGEWKRLGLANKPLIVVPNHLTQQWQDSFTELYPAARILVPTKEDFKKENRKRLMAQIANNDWDAVVMAQSHFLRVSVKVETLRAFIKEQEDQMLADGAQQMRMSTEEFQELVSDYGAEQAMPAGSKSGPATQALSSRNAPRSVKDIARGILTLRARLQKRLNQIGKDAPVTFEELGVDGLLVDEAHLYKNLYFSTAMNGIAGLKGSDSDRAMDMFLKVRQINAQSKGRNVIFATGTPVSNTLSELFTMFRYLAQPTLDRMGMSGFDSWAHGNAEASAEMEKSAGTGYKERTRLRSWSNLRELSAQFRKFSDVLTTDDLIASGAVKIPKRKGNSATVVALEPHPDMPAFMAEIDDRLEALKKGDVDPRVDNHLLVTTHAAMAAIDMRLVKPGSAADPNGRIPTAAVEIAKRYKATAANKSTQIVFLDVGIPDAKQMPPLPKTVTAGPTMALAPPTEDAEEADPDLVDPEAEGEAAMKEIREAGHARNLYEDLRQQLVAQGIKDDEIAYVHQAQTPYELGQLYAAVNDGRIRVLMASTSKGATGMNVQKKLVAIHHLDVPWRPADVEQRNGRIFRQGNENDEAEEIRYVTKRSFDEYRWSVLATKQQGIVALMKGQLTSMDDVDPSQLDYEVASALANGDPRALDLLNKERQIKALRTRYTAYVRRINAAKREVSAGESAIETYSARAEGVLTTLAAARTWAETRQLTVVDRVAGYPGQDTTDRVYDFGDTDARKELQDRLERLMRPEPYRDSYDIGTAGPYELVLNKTEADVWTAGNLEKRTGYFVTVKAQIGAELLVVGSTPTWQVGGEFPNFARSLDTYLNPKKLQELADGYANQLRMWNESLAENRAIADKPFAQLDQLNQAEAELKELRAGLSGTTPATPAADAAPDGDQVQSFDQPPIDQPEGRRGNVRFETDALTGRRKTTITLPPNADLSTFLHETGHVFLEVFGDLVDKVRARDPETLTRAQRRLLADYDALLQEFKVPDRARIGRTEHEHFATQFERYLMEGEAPSVELRSTFARFRSWLLDVYRALKNIGSPLSPELRGIFDRMLASEDAIEAAERDAPPLFTSAEQAGMSPQQFALYREKAEQAHRTTRETLDKKLAAEVRAERSADRAAQRAEIETVVRGEVLAEPIYRALAAMQTGTGPDGASLLEGSEPVPLQLNRARLVEQFGEERVAALPAGILTDAGGTSADLVASFFGFSSGDELLQAVAAAPPADVAIATETDKRLAAANPTLATDGRLLERARAAVANTDREALIRAEVKALWQNKQKAQQSYERRWLEAEARLRIAMAEGHKQVEIDALTTEVRELKAKARGGAATIRRALPSEKTLKAAAAARVARTRIRDLRPTVFWSAARKAAKEALALAARQDLAGAIEAKTRELTALANHRATVQALEDADQARAWIQDHDTTAARGRTGLAGADYLDQWDGILDRFEFKRVSRKVLDRRAAIGAWIAAQQAAGLPVELPDIVLNDALRVNYQQLTVEQFAGVTDGLKSLIHLARLKLGLMRAKEQRSFEAVRDELAASIREKSPARKVDIEPKDDWLANKVAAHTNLSTFGFQLDGNEYTGPFWDAIVRPANEAASAEEARSIESGTAYRAIVETHYPGRALLTWADKVFIPAIHDSLSKEGRLAVAMNWGNATSRQRVLADPFLNWTELQVQAVLDTLDQNDWEFVQAHWDYLNTFWPEIAAKSERLTGLPPEKVEAVPVVTKFGEYRGGYHPLVYDHRKSAQVGQTAAVSEAKLAVAGAMLHATTRRGHEETRLQDVRLPIRLDMQATSQHLQQVIHDLTHHEFLIDATRLLRDKDVAAAIHETRGAGVQARLGKILLDIATGDRLPGRPTLIENGAAWLRTRTQIAGLGLNLWTSLQQPLGVFNGMERVGIGWVAKGAGLWARDAVTMQKTVAAIFDKSAMMRNRYGTATADLHDLRHTLSHDGGWFDRLVRTVSQDHVTQQAILDSYMWFIGAAQQFADKPTWLGEYLKQMDADPNDEAHAIAAADQAVLDSQGGGQIKDLAEVQRGSQVGKLFMTFASYSVMALNSTARAAGQTNFKSPTSALTFAGHLALIYALPAFFTEALRCGVGKARCDEVPQFLARVGGQSLSTALNGIFLVREAVADVNYLLGQDTGPRGYAGPAGTRPFEILSQLTTQVHQGKLDKGLERAAVAASGIVFKYPAAQVQRSIDGWIALSEGRTHNPAALLMGAPPKRGAR